ncbi:MAG: hypothetical protein IJ617_04005 [Oscillospiraceae bacterium]|nr:hypothetical protein [Oscillospiraceae bacterium]
MKANLKKTLALVLAIAMVMSFASISVFAEAETELSLFVDPIKLTKSAEAQEATVSLYITKDLGYGHGQVDVEIPEASAEAITLNLKKAKLIDFETKTQASDTGFNIAGGVDIELTQNEAKTGYLLATFPVEIAAGASGEYVFNLTVSDLGSSANSTDLIKDGTFTNNTAKVTIQITEVTYTVTFSVTLDGEPVAENQDVGKVYIDGVDNAYYCNDDATLVQGDYNLKVVTATGYELASVTGADGKAIPADETDKDKYPVSITADTKITFDFTGIGYAIDTKGIDAEKATVTVPATAKYGEEVEATITAKTGYSIVDKSIAVTNADEEAVEFATSGTAKATTVKFTMPASDVAIAAEFEEATSLSSEKLILSILGQNVDVKGNGTAASPEEVEVTLAADDATEAITAENIVVSEGAVADIATAAKEDAIASEAKFDEDGKATFFVRVTAEDEKSVAWYKVSVVKAANTFDVEAVPDFDDEGNITVASDISSQADAVAAAIENGDIGDEGVVVRSKSNMTAEEADEAPVFTAEISGVDDLLDALASGDDEVGGTFETDLATMSFPGSAVASLIAEGATSFKAERTNIETGKTISEISEILTDKNPAYREHAERATAEKKSDKDRTITKIFSIGFMNGDDEVNLTTAEPITYNFFIGKGLRFLSPAIWWMNPAGEAKDVGAEYDPATGNISFSVDHTSDYVLVVDEAGEYYIEDVSDEEAGGAGYWRTITLNDADDYSDVYVCIFFQRAGDGVTSWTSVMLEGKKEIYVSYGTDIEQLAIYLTDNVWNLVDYVTNEGTELYQSAFVPELEA